jgi:hypothetical protein
VNVITFTDGIDISSTGPSPLENHPPFATEDDYGTYVDDQIDTRIIDGKPITAYSVGIFGETNKDLISQFQNDLKKVASDGKDYELTDLSELTATFEGIADSLQTEELNTFFNMRTSTFSSGTKIRMTFETEDAPASEVDSARFIEGTLIRTGPANEFYSFENITYGGGLGSIEGAGPIPGTIEHGKDGDEVIFAFTGVEGFVPGYDDAADVELYPIHAHQYFLRQNVWITNDEYKIGGDTDIDIVKRSALIYLVLDASRSLNTTQIGQIREAVIDFINLVYDKAH